MKISIITVTYNCRATIERTILSVLSQKYKNYEYIIIDGGSTDGTVEIIDKYRDRLAYFISEPDDGIYDAMNKGLKRVSGDIVHFLNGNDYYYDANVLATIQKRFSEHTDVDVIIAKVMSDGKVCNTYLPGENISIYLDAHFPHQATFAKATLYTQYGDFDPEYSICADYDWILRIYKSGRKLYWCDDIVVYYDTYGVSSSIKCVAEQYLVSKKYVSEMKIFLPVNVEDYYADEFRKVFSRNLLKRKVVNKEFKPIIAAIVQGENEINIWGAGYIGNMFCEFLVNNGIKVKYVIDSDTNKIGHTINDISICGIDDAEDNFIIISSEDYETDIGCLLEERGMLPDKDFITYTKFTIEFIKKLLECGYDDGGFQKITGIDVLKNLKEQVK
ncbi:MAG: glycosyltransferase [Lachnospiraceae bacterium]|nr:glycosyltransferase [Lachnospiraceae bacterium]